MKSKIIFPILLLIIFGSIGNIFAQTFSKSDIQPLFDSLEKNKITKGDFIQEKNVTSLNRSLKSSGSFIFCDEGIVWKTQKPFPSTVALTKTSMIVTNDDGTKTVVDGSENPIFQSVAQTLSSLFSGNKEKLELYFEIKDFSKNENDWLLLLSPKDNTISQAITEISLSGKIESNSFYSFDLIKITQGEKGSTSYTLTNKAYPQELTNEEIQLFK